MESEEKVEATRLLVETFCEWPPKNISYVWE